MLDLATLAAIAASAVTVLTPLLGKAVESSAEELGKSAMTSLLDKLKQRLGHPGAKEALEDLARQPSDADAQAALRLQLRKAMEQDPELVAFLKDWAKESAPAAGVSQVANVTGNQNQTVQISGSGNRVG
jgi:type II secretory pathway pseudopilin PulG